MDFKTGRTISPKVLAVKNLGDDMYKTWVTISAKCRDEYNRPRGEGFLRRPHRTEIRVTGLESR